MAEGDVIYTVVVPTYNRADLLPGLLASLEVQTLADHMEVIVVDDVSMDNTEAVVQSWLDKGHPFPARFIRQEQNQGPGAARNAGLAEARGNVVAFVDSDCVVEPGWLEALCAPIDPENHVIGVGGRVLATAADPISHYFEFNRSLEPPASRQYLVTCNCAFDRAVLSDAGGFEAQYRIAEDLATSIKLWKRGGRFAFAPEAVARHAFRPSLRDFYRTWWGSGDGVAVVFHQQLTAEERGTGSGDGTHNENFWDGRLNRPAVTGVRSFFRGLGQYHGHARAVGLPWRLRLHSCVLHAIARVAYYRGWRHGLGRIQES